MRVIKFVSHISCSEVIISPGGKIMVYIERLSLMQSWGGGGGGWGNTGFNFVKQFDKSYGSVT